MRTLCQERWQETSSCRTKESAGDEGPEVNQDGSEAGGPEDPIDSLLGVALAVNKALQRHIRVHDAVLERRFSLRDVLPLPFFFRPIDFHAHFRETESVLVELESAQRQIDTARATEVAAGQDVHELSACLAEYVAALQQTVRMLSELCHRLFRKSQGDPFSWREYNELLDGYSASTTTYAEAGSRLSAIVRRIDPDFLTEKPLQAATDCFRSERRAQSERVRMRQYDPELRLSFCELVCKVLQHYRRIETPDDISALLDRSRVTDITDLPQTKMMDALMPLPPGFTQRTYQFRECRSRRGVFDVAFHGDRLVNFRGQLLFLGSLGSIRAAVFFSTRLRALMHGTVGMEFQYEPGIRGFRADAGDDLLVAFCRPAGEPYVSVYITDRAYA